MGVGGVGFLDYCSGCRVLSDGRFGRYRGLGVYTHPQAIQPYKALTIRAPPEPSSPESLEA